MLQQAAAVGPSLNGLKSEDIALMGETDDDKVLKQLDNLLVSR